MALVGGCYWQVMVTVRDGPFPVNWMVTVVLGNAAPWSVTCCVPFGPSVPLEGEMLTVRVWDCPCQLIGCWPELPSVMEGQAVPSHLAFADVGLTVSWPSVGV